MVGDDLELAALAATDFVGVAVALGARQIHSAGGGEFVERTAMARGSLVGALGVGNLQQVHANAGEADGLSRRGTGIAHGHPFEIDKVDATGNG